MKLGLMVALALALASRTASADCTVDFELTNQTGAPIRVSMVMVRPESSETPTDKVRPKQTVADGETITISDQKLTQKRGDALQVVVGYVRSDQKRHNKGVIAQRFDKLDCAKKTFKLAITKRSMSQ